MITLGFIISGPTEIYWYGLEIPAATRDELLTRYAHEAEIDILDVCQDVFNGLLINDPEALASSGLEIRYFFPDEEDAEQIGQDRRVDLSQVRVTVRDSRRQRCAPGNYYLCGGDYREPYSEIRFYQTRFLPPFRSTDVRLIIDDLRDFGFNGYILADLKYDYQDMVYQETSPLPGKKLASRILTDG